MKNILAVFIILFVSFNLLSAEPVDENDPGKEAKQVIPGFQKGALYFSLVGGIMLSTGGSLIEHEKVFDENQRFLLSADLFDPPVTSISGSPYQFEKQHKPIGQMGLEFGANDYIGIGMTVLHFAIESSRQVIHPFINASTTTGELERGDFLDPFASEKTLYQGTAMLFQITLHPFNKRSVDPYIALRTGIGGFAGNAYRNLQYDRLRMDSKIKNGITRVFGAAVGLNFYLKKSFGVRVEGGYYRQMLQSNIFSFRGLTSTQIQAGLFMNISNL